MVTGPSGVGKSTLLFDVLGASAEAGRPLGCEALEGLERFTHHHLTRATPSRSPLTTLGLGKAVQSLFHGVGSGLKRGAFSFHSAAGRCPACKGTGQTRVSLDFAADLVLDCETCEGTRFQSEVLEVRWQGLSVADLLATPADALRELPLGPALQGAAQALCRLGLAHVSLGTPGDRLSGGEHQRVVLAGALSRPEKGPGLFLLDEPASGLADADGVGLVDVVRTLVKRGSCVIATSHRRLVIDSAGWQVTLSGGGGAPVSAATLRR